MEKQTGMRKFCASAFLPWNGHAGCMADWVDWLANRLTGFCHALGNDSGALSATHSRKRFWHVLGNDSGTLLATILAFGKEIRYEIGFVKRLCGKRKRLTKSVCVTPETLRNACAANGDITKYVFMKPEM